MANRFLGNKTKPTSKFNKFLVKPTIKNTTQKEPTTASRFLTTNKIVSVNPKGFSTANIEKQNAEAFAKFGVKAPTGPIKASIPPTLGGPKIGYEFRSKDVWGDQFVTPRTKADNKTRLELAGENQIFDKYGNLTGEVNHIAPKWAGGTEAIYNKNWLPNIRTEKEAKEKKDISFTAGQQSGRVLKEIELKNKFDKGEITQGQAIVELLAWDEFHNKPSEKPSNYLTGKEALKESVKQKALQFGANLLKPLAFIAKTGLQTTLAASRFSNMALASTAKALGDKDLKNVSFDDLWKQSKDTSNELMMKVGAPTDVFKKQTKTELEQSVFEDQYRKIGQELREANAKGDAGKFLKSFGKASWLKFTEDWSNPFFLFSIKGSVKGSGKLTPREKVVMETELNPAKSNFLQGPKQKVKESTTVYQIKADSNVVASSAKPGAKIKPTESPNLKMYVTQKTDGTIKVKVTNSGGEIFNKNAIRQMAETPAETKIVDNLQLKPQSVERAISDVSSKANRIITGDMTKMTPVGQKILDLQKTIKAVDSPGQLYQEIANVIKSDKTLTPEIAKKLLSKEAGLGGTFKDFFIGMKDKELAALPQFSPYVKAAEESALKVFGGKPVTTKLVKLSDIKTGLMPALEAKANLNEAKIKSFEDVYKNGGRVQPLPVYQENGQYFLNKDGYHRFTAQKNLGVENVAVEIQPKTALSATAKQKAELKTQPLSISKKTISEKIGQRINKTAEQANISTAKNKVAREKAIAKEPGFEISPETRLEFFERQLVDKLNRIKNIQKQITAQKGPVISEEADAYLQAEVYIGKAANHVETLEKDFVVPFVKKMTDKGIKIDDFDLFLNAKHAAERNAQIAKINTDFKDGGSGLTNAQADKIINAVKNSGKLEEFEALAKEYYQNVTEKRLQTLVDSGLIKQETADKLRATYKNYVPLKGKAGVESFGARGQGFSVSGKDIKRAKGRSSIADSPSIQGVIDLEDALIRAEKNKVSQAFLKLVEENPNKSLWEVESLKYKPVFDKSGELQYMDPKYKFVDNVLEVRVDGKTKLITIHDKALAQAMKNMGVERGIDVLVKINNYLRAVNTTLNPEFVITNFERDLQTAGINLAGEQSAKMAKNVVKDIPSAMKGIYKNVRNGDVSSEWAKVYEDLKKNGGKMGFFKREAVEEKLNTLRKLVSDYNSDKVSSKFSKALRGTFNYIEDVNEVVEMAVRTSAYKNAIQQGLSEAKAASLAKNLTVNFNKKGNLGVMINSLYLFANAGIQGTMRVFNALKYKGVRRIVYGIIAGSFGLAELNKAINEEEYNKLGDDFNNRNMAFMLPNGNHVKIKLPYGYNIFKVMGDITSDIVHGGDKSKAIKRLFLALDASWNPLSSATIPQLVSPTLTDPLVQHAENKNWFGGPIKPEQLSFGAKEKESSLYFSTVRPQSKAITDWLNDITGGTGLEAGFIDVSPEIIDHYLDTYIGGSGKFLSNIIGSGVDLAKGDMPDLENMPFVRQFYGSSPEYADKGVVVEFLDNAETKLYSKDDLVKLKKALAKIREKKEWDDDKIKDMIKSFENGQNKIKASRALEKIKKDKMTREQVKEFVQGLPSEVQNQIGKLIKKDIEDFKKLQK